MKDNAAYISLVKDSLVKYVVGMTHSRDRLGWAQDLYEQAMFYGEPDALAVADAELNGVEADLALARGRVMHVRVLRDRKEDPREIELFQRAAELYHEIGDGRAEGEALFWVGIVHQVVRDDTAASLPFFERAGELATEAGDRLTQSYVVRHLGFAEMEAGRTDTARGFLEESVRLRRELTFGPGVAAGLLALAELAHKTDRLDEAKKHLAEARAVAEESGAHGTLKWIAAAEAEIKE